MTNVHVCVSDMHAYLRNYMSNLRHIFVQVRKVTYGPAMSSTGGVAIRCVLPVLWMTLYLRMNGP